MNAIARNRGLQWFAVRGPDKARAIALWFALAHNLMRTVVLRAHEVPRPWGDVEIGNGLAVLEVGDRTDLVRRSANQVLPDAGDDRVLLAKNDLPVGTPNREILGSPGATPARQRALLLSR